MTTTTLTASVGTPGSTAAPVGAPVTLTAEVNASSNGVLGGMVTFMDGATAIGTSELCWSSAGSTRLRTRHRRELAPGSHSITAVYSGEPGVLPSTSAATTLTVRQDATATTLAVSQEAGQPTTLTATVSVVAPGTGTPTGTVTFQGISMAGGSPSYATFGTVDLTTSAGDYHGIDHARPLRHGEAAFDDGTIATYSWATPTTRRAPTRNSRRRRRRLAVCLPRPRQ